MKRRVATGYNSNAETIPPPVLRWQEAVRDPGVYDLEVDTSQLNAHEWAGLIRQRLAGSSPTTFAQLAGDG
ncbi:MAG: hypothetical protein ACK47M_08265 [Caldilinea sp.]